MNGNPQAPTSSYLESSLTPTATNGQSFLKTVEVDSDKVMQNILSGSQTETSYWQIGLGVFVLVLALGGLYYFYTVGRSNVQGGKYGLVALLGDIIKKTTNMGAVGTTELSTGIASSIDKGVDAIDKSVGEKSAVATMKVDDPYLDATENSPEVVPDDTTHNSKARYCFIGTANGVRSCARLDKSTKCMSGEVFPSLNICVNPALRV